MICSQHVTPLVIVLHVLLTLLSPTGIVNMSHHHMMTPCGATIISSLYPRTNEIVQCCPAHTVP